MTTNITATTTLTASAFDSAEQLLIPDYMLLPHGVVTDHGVVISAGRFGDVGPAEELVARHPHLTARHLVHQLLMPGFVDTHHHLTQSFGKSMAFGEPSEIFRRLWVPLERHLDDESIYIASKLAALESLRGGFTTVCDAGTRAEVDLASVAAASRETGLRLVLGYICNDLGANGSTVDARTVRRRAEQHLTRWESNGLVHPSLAVSIPEAATARVLADSSLLAAEAGVSFQIHLNEHLASVERSIEHTGLRPLEYMYSIGALGPQVLAAHATLLTPREIRLLADTGTAVSYNPVASAWKGNAVAPALQLAEERVRFGIGTDGTRGDAFRLLDVAELAQRLSYGLSTGDSSCGAGWTWLQHATEGGADAAGLAGMTGQIAPGFAADYLLVDWSVPEVTPSWDPAWELVRYANRDQIAAVVVGGKLRLLHGWPVDWDAHAFIDHARGVAERIIFDAPMRKLHPTAAEHRSLRIVEREAVPGLAAL